MSAIIALLKRHGIDLIPVLDAYAESHRYYHTLDHIHPMMQRWMDSVYRTNDALGLAIVFHDSVYNPTSSTNEADSATLFDRMYSQQDRNLRDTVVSLILATRLHRPTSELEVALCEWDLWPFIHGPASQLLKDDYLIFKEYQIYDFSVYRTGRLNVLNRLKENPLVNSQWVDVLIDHNQRWQPRIGLCVDLFNDSQTQLLSRIREAEQVFDKVIIGLKKQPGKVEPALPVLPKGLKYHQVLYIDKPIADLLTDFPYPVTQV